jgi:hypothetical protein
MINNFSQKKKIVLIVFLAAASIVVIGLFIRSLGSSSTSSRRQPGPSSLSITDENGDKWVLAVTKGQLLSRLKDNGAKAGPPLLLKTDVKTSGRDVSIGLIIEGQAGEKYASGAEKNGQLQPPPGLKIVDETGKTLATGVFKYG